MQIKSFSARSGKEVLARIKEELGPEAVILDSREENGIITMTAATERDPVREYASQYMQSPWEEGMEYPDRQGGWTDLTGQNVQRSLPLPGIEPMGGRGMRYQPVPQETPSGPPRPLSAARTKNMPLVPAEAANGNVLPEPRARRPEDAAAEAFRAAQARTRAMQKPITVPTREETGGGNGAERLPYAPQEAGPGAGAVFRQSGHDVPGGAGREAAWPAKQTARQAGGPPAGQAGEAGGRTAEGVAGGIAGGVAGGIERRQGHDRREDPFGPGNRLTAPGAFAVPLGWQQWHDEWSGLKNQIMALMKPALRLDELPPRQRLAIEFLQREGVSDEAVLSLYQRLRQDPAVSILEPLSNLVAVRAWGTEYWPQRIQVVAGPFGAGKTSVAIRMALFLRKTAPERRICLVNADATRGNGRLLLRHYCDLSELAYKEAATTLELVTALNAALREGYDRILVDLPGLSRGRFLASLLNDAGLGEHTGESPDDLAVHLALPPHYGTLQMRGLLKRYKTEHAGSIVWTKLDEAEHYGQLVNAAVESALPVSALSFGPGLGNSLVPAKENMLWRLLFKRELPTA